MQLHSQPLKHILQNTVTERDQHTPEKVLELLGQGNNKRELSYSHSV